MEGRTCIGAHVHGPLSQGPMFLNVQLSKDFGQLPEFPTQYDPPPKLCLNPWKHPLQIYPSPKKKEKEEEIKGTQVLDYSYQSSC